jgi:hypothetical protein
MEAASRPAIIGGRKKASDFNRSNSNSSRSEKVACLLRNT